MREGFPQEVTFKPHLHLTSEKMPRPRWTRNKGIPAEGP